MPPLPAVALDHLDAQVDRYLSFEQLHEYTPYTKQQLFHALGSIKRERLLRAGNQNGKSFCGGREAAFHLTGLYPDWWQGKRFDRPILLWAAGETAESTRDNPQKQLLGEVGADEFGTGAIPLRLIGETATASGTADLFDYVKVKHVSGGWSTCRFKYYAQGRRKWQGPKVDVVWFDEEPPEDIYNEGLARTIASAGITYITATLLLGMSTVVKRFLMEKNDARAEVRMTIHDALHLSPEQRKIVIASFPAHERKARADGEAILGSGRIYPVEDELLLVDAFVRPRHFAVIKGMDFGWTHPTACVELWHDRDMDIVYVARTYRRVEQPPAVHSIAINASNRWAPVAWPHDGHNETAAGPQLAQQYKDCGVNMRPTNARMLVEDTSGNVNPRTSQLQSKETTSPEAGVLEILDRMLGGRLKVLRGANGDLLEEIHLYHREDGKIVKEMDDALDALRMGIMDLRFAEVEPRRAEPMAPSFIPSDAGMGY